MSWHNRAAGLGALGLVAVAVGGCPQSGPPPDRPLVMPVRGTPPPRLTPVAKIEVDDSEDARRVASGAPELLGAVEAYRAGNHQAALARFFEVMRDSLRPPVPKQLAEMYAAKALIGLELPHAAWMILDGIAQKPHHVLRGSALPWLGLLSSHIDTDAVLESLASYEAAERGKLTTQKPPVLERLAYLFGRRAFLKGQGDAVELLEAVSEEAADHPKALFMLGVMHVRNKDALAALDTFEAVQSSLIRPGLEEPEKIRAMTTMAQARVVYELGDSDPAKLTEALALYRKAQSFESVASDARLETVWTLVRLEKLDEAARELAATRPTLRTRVAEADGLGVIIGLKQCKLGEAESALTKAKAHHNKVSAELERMLAGDTAEHVPMAVAFGDGRRKPNGVTEEVIAVAASRSRLARMLRRFASIKAEQKRANALPLDFRSSAAGKKVTSLVDAAIARTEAAVAAHLAHELEELGQITKTQLAELDKLSTELATLKSGGC